MTLKQAIEVLKIHSLWRKGAEITPVNPKELTEALEIALNLMKKTTRIE